MACGAVLSYWDDSGNLNMWESDQGVDRDLPGIATYWSLPRNKVRLDGTYTYGQFGTRTNIDGKHISAALAKKAGKPVQLVYSKEEETRDNHSNPDSTIHLKMGFKNNGKITALENSGVWGGGSCGSPPISGTSTRSPFYLHYYPTSSSAWTTVFYNTNRRGPYRGLACINEHWAIEQMLDEASEKLKIHPVDMHLLNQTKTGDQIKSSKTGAQPVLAMTDMTTCINRAADAIKYRERWKGHTTPVAVDGDKKRGLGMADFVHGGTPAVGNSAVKVDRTGKVEIYCCIPDPGTGCKTIACQFVAEELGVLYEDVRIASHDTSMPPGGGCYGSRATPSIGWTVTLAARQAKAEVLKVAAAQLKVTPAELTSKNREIYVTADPTKKMTFAAACALLPGSDVIGQNTYSYPGMPQTTRNYGTDAFEVEVDTEIGEVAIKKIAVSNDCGRAVNPRHLIVQMGGGMTQGIGYSMMEEYIYDAATGVMLNPRGLEYKFPTSMDFPQELFEMMYVEPVDPTCPFGAHGASEGIMDPTAAVIANAIYNACGARIKEGPITPDKILKALGKI
jgi:xanthine dehydrogenase molybdenum-binding subunit